MFDEAVRENRQGRLRIVPDACEPAAVEAVRARMLVYSKINDTLRGHCIWIGYSPDFEAVPLGAAAPDYEAVISCSLRATESPSTALGPPHDRQR
jgi:hypothetical protein